MKSFCIKTNNKKAIEYLLNKINTFPLDNLFYSYRNFKIYKNIIIHYTGNDENIFLYELSKLLASLVVNEFEEKIINKLVLSEYFYFNQLERMQIVNTTIEDLYNDDESLYPFKKTFEILCNDFYEYLLYHKSIVLKGFLTFRIKNYFEIINDQIDKSVNKFIVEREYTEFVALLKMYISTETNHCDIIHLIYNNSKPILLDENKNPIETNSNMFNAKYLSDITFSSNDFALNTLLTLNPKILYIHLIDNPIDEFISTLKLIFENKAIYCRDCNICKIYKNKKAIY